MPEVLRIVSGVATPIGLIGVAIVAVCWYLVCRLKSEEKRLALLPESERAKIADTQLTRYELSGANLTREQKAHLIHEEMKKRHLLPVMGIWAGVAVIALAVVAYIFGPVPAPSVNEASSLELRPEKQGEMFIDEKGGQGALFEFTLSNSIGGLAIVDDVAIEVLDVIEDKTSVAQALVNT